MIESTTPIVFAHPEVLWLLLLAPMLALRLPRSRGAERARNFAAVLGRIVGYCLLIGGAAEPERVLLEPDLSVVVAVDRSASMEPRVQPLIQRAQALTEGLPNVRRVELGATPVVDAQAAPRDPADGTDLSALLDLAAGASESARSRHILLVTDGADTRHEGPPETTHLLAAQGVKVFPIVPSPASNGRITGLSLPESPRTGERVTATVDLEGNASAVELVLQDQVVASGQADGRRVVLDFVAPPAGLHAVTARLSPRDAWPLDDTRTTWLQTRPPPQLLWVGQDPGWVAAALRRGDRRLVTHEGLRGLTEGATAVIANPDLSTWTAEDTEALAGWVARGGNLVLAGGEEGLGHTAPWWEELEEVLPVVLPDDKRPAPAPLALVYVLDRSDSMMRLQKMELAITAILESLEALHPSSQIAVLGFSDFADWVVDFTPAAESEAIGERVKGIGISGGTDIYPALRTAGRALERTEAAFKHIILLTDGQGISRLQQNISTVEGLARDNVTVSTVALSSEAAIDEMATVARMTRGRAYVVREYEELPRIVVDETMMVVDRNARDEQHAVVPVPASPLSGSVDWDDAPDLTGFNLSKPRGAADLGLRLDTGDPLLASWRYGLGSATVFASSLGGGWTAGWSDWRPAGTWLIELIEAIEARPPVRHADLELEATDDGVAVRVFVLDALSNPREGLDLEVVARGAQGTRSTALAPTAPGTYEATIPWDGALWLTVDLPPSAIHPPITLQGRAHPPLPEELAIGTPLDDPVRVTRIAEITGGSIDPDRGALLADVREVERREPLRPWLWLAGLASLLVDVAIRRLPAGYSGSETT